MRNNTRERISAERRKSIERKRKDSSTANKGKSFIVDLSQSNRKTRRNSKSGRRETSESSDPTRVIRRNTTEPMKRDRMELCISG